MQPFAESRGRVARLQYSCSRGTTGVEWDTVAICNILSMIHDYLPAISVVSLCARQDGHPARGLAACDKDEKDLVGKRVGGKKEYSHRPPTEADNPVDKDQ